MKNLANSVSQDLTFADNNLAAVLYGELNKNLLLVEQKTGIKIHVRGSGVTLCGLEHEVALASDC